MEEENRRRAEVPRIQFRLVVSELGFREVGLCWDFILAPWGWGHACRRGFQVWPYVNFGKCRFHDKRYTHGSLEHKKQLRNGKLNFHGLTLWLKQ